MSLSAYLRVENNNVVISNILIEMDGTTLFSGDLTSYQLLATSRIGFLGCWLELTSKAKTGSSQNGMSLAAQKHVFIFRDAFSEQDYARLNRIIRQLH